MNENDLSELIKDSLFINEKDSNIISSTILTKTKGNPFFSCQLLRDLYQKEMIVIFYLFY